MLEHITCLFLCCAAVDLVLRLNLRSLSKCACMSALERFFHNERFKLNLTQVHVCLKSRVSNKGNAFVTVLNAKQCHTELF